MDLRRKSKRSKNSYSSATKKKKTNQRLCKEKKRINDSKMPAFQSLNSECMMEVDEAPSLSNCEEVKKKANNVYEKLTTGVHSANDSAAKFDGLMNSCKTLVLFEAKNHSNISKLSDITKKAEELLKENQRFCKRYRYFLETKSFLFTTPLNTIKTHPEFHKISISLNAAATDWSVSPIQEVLNNDGLEVLTVLPPTKSKLPPAGVVKRKELLPGTEVWVMKSNLLDVFVQGTILSSCEADNKKWYKVRFDETKTIANKLYTAKQLAYRTNPDVILPVGTRIAARYSDGEEARIYAGIVAEPPKVTNQERYLIFFDDGYAQYIDNKDIYVVCYQSIDVADDVHENISEFIRTYLQKYPERPMVKLQKNEITKTEFDRKWWDTKVVDVDASMVKMLFIATNRTEWIYRGSTRLKLLYNELANAEANRVAGKHRRHNVILRKPHQPYVEYTRERDTKASENHDIETIELDSESDTEEGKVKVSQHPRRKTGGSQFLTNGEKPRNTARKSTSLKPRESESTNVDKDNTPDIQSHLGYKDLHNLVSFVRVDYKTHVCSKACAEKASPAEFKGRNPLLIPIYVGWERQIWRYSGDSFSKIRLMYRAPCGRHLRNLGEILKFLILTESKLTIDYFTLNPFLVVFRTFRPKEIKYEHPDVTQGKENVPVRCVNSWENVAPPYVEYSPKRYPGKGVYLNEDKEFLVGCDCTDNCQTPELCECQRITSYAYSGHYNADVGYKFRRLKEPVVTGIFECNSKCKCGPHCGNRVVQNGMKVRLQMFKTKRKGWGIRCLDDIEAGAFICIYAGQLLTEQGADEDGNLFGDEYLAELDHIEVAEKLKEGYESGVSDIEDMEVDELKSDDEDYKMRDEEQSSSSSDSDVNVCDTDSEYETSLRSTAINSYSTRSRRKSLKLSDYSSLSSKNSQSNNKNSKKKNNKKKELPDLTASQDSSKAIAKKGSSTKHSGSAPPAIPSFKQKGHKSVRSYYGEDSLYIMDAKSKGNIGRYLNHSCAPNVFVQNVFVTSHDLRFPEVAFFAQNYILAGTELTWDYNYEVGSVEGKVMYCYCDARNCRGRLL
ncbi:histone-lysine N-methyltransferase SETDB1-like isoform X2 [Argiope bruennichi]|uniref:histone-lysine N-methyltransferase SETDB1-like isoform X2 n=1 Tax=Argiope bruennichi TaxID=94029 RepID=UPI00249574F2|nr:histone-lysine N-methyltransferase SETDB1-like isoform X2 [Argiope bruennichi]